MFNLVEFLNNTPIFHIKEEIHNLKNATDYKTHYNLKHISFDYSTSFYVDDRMTEIDCESKKLIYIYNLYNSNHSIITNIDSNVPIKVFIGNLEIDTNNTYIAPYLAANRENVIKFYMPSEVSTIKLKINCYILDKEICGMLKSHVIYTKNITYMMKK